MIRDKRSRTYLDPEPNLIPLLDFLLLLLIIFIVMLGANLHQITLQLPKVDTKKTIAKNIDLYVLINAKGDLSINQKKISSWQAFSAVLISTHNNHPNQELMIGIDKNAPAEILLKLISLARTEQITVAQVIVR